MKTTDKIILISGLAFGILFYQQDFGINYLIFTVLQLFGMFLISKKEERSSAWWLTLSGCVISGFSVLLYGSFLAVFTNVISLLLLAGLSIEARSSVLVGLIQSGYSVFSGVGYAVNKLAAKASDESGIKKTPRKFKNAVIFLVSFLVAILFFSLYRNSSTAFKDLTDNIDWSFISFGWISFTAIGYYMIYYLYHQNQIEALKDYDLNTPDQISEEKSSSKLDKMMSTESENTWARTLLIMLNSLLFVVLLVDGLSMANLYENTNPNVDYSANVHQGVGALIWSIIFAVSLILFFFKGRLNFIQNSKGLRWLATGWIIQNTVLVLFTAFKNVEYIQEFFLTYKRIGVFAYLLCCLVGLVFTFMKIKNVKSNWFLVKRVGWTLYAIAIFTPLVNWDHLIINYNFEQARITEGHLDVAYLLDLPSENYPLIESHLKGNPAMTNELSQLQKIKRDQFIENQENSDWRSFNLRKYYAYNNYKFELK